MVQCLRRHPCMAPWGWRDQDLVGLEGKDDDLLPFSGKSSQDLQVVDNHGDPKSP